MIAAIIALELLVPSDNEVLTLSCVGLVSEKTIFEKCLGLSLDCCIFSLASRILGWLDEISSDDDVHLS